MKKFSLIILISLILAMLFPYSAWAHPADMYYHTYLVEISPEGILITWQLVPGPMIAQGIWFDADRDQDTLVSDREASEWVSTYIGLIDLEIDGTTVGLDLNSVAWPSSPEVLFSGEEPVQAVLEGFWPAGISEDSVLVLQNRFNPKNSLSWFEVTTAGDLSFEVPVQNSGKLELEFGPLSETASQARLTSWESGSPSVPWVVESVGLGDLAEDAATEAQISPAEGSSPSAILEGLIMSGEGSFGFLLSALFLAALLGALHALSPGHGKTIVAAYLVGAQGKAYHAVALGGIVTLTHTGSVFALGIVTLAASRYLLPGDVFPVLELVSGLLILFLGLGLLYPRLKLWVTEYRKKRPRKQVGQIESQKDKGEGYRLEIKMPIEEIGPEHSHDPSQLGAIPRGPSPEGPLSEIRWRNLIPLAISGGLVPCPDAIAILLVAATINRIMFGLGLIISFSLGLAVILIVIGLLIVQGKRLFERLRWFNQASLVMPVISAFIVLGAGGFLTASAIGNIQGSPLAFARASDLSGVDLAARSVIYTDLDDERRSQMYLVPAGGGDPEKLTSGSSVWNYQVSPDGTSVIYATDDGLNGSQLWSWNEEDNNNQLLYECVNAYCSEVTWSPDGQGILYSRLDFDPELNPGNVQTIWWLDLESGETAPLFQDTGIPGFSARWSPSGEWISYSSINPLEIKIYQMQTGEYITIPNSLGYPAAWSPDSLTLIFLDLESSEGGHLSKLYSYSLADGWQSMLGSGENYDESSPSWSPDGEWLAVLRRAWVEGLPEDGNQIWIMRPDGTDAKQLTGLSQHTLDAPAWSPDGRYLVFGFRVVREDQIENGIMILDLETEDLFELVDSGSNPSWIH